MEIILLTVEWFLLGLESLTAAAKLSQGLQGIGAKR